MTQEELLYEELLAKISVNAHYPECDVCSCGEKFEGFEHHLNSISSKKDNALRTILELHKPSDYESDWDNEGFVCEECEKENPFYSVVWPCPTIQAIEKELK